MAQPNLTKNSIEPIVVGQLFAQNATPEVIAQDSSVILAGTVLGRIEMSTSGPGSIAIGTAGNTGTGAVTMDATQPCQPGARPGIYTVFFTGAAAGYVTGPDGVQIGAVFSSLPNPWTQQLKFVVSGTPDSPATRSRSPFRASFKRTGPMPVPESSPSTAQPRCSPARSPGFTPSTSPAPRRATCSIHRGCWSEAAFAALPNPWNNELKFVVTGTPQAGDVSYIFITAGSGKLKRMAAINFDGSQYPIYVANLDYDTTAGDLAVGISSGLIASAPLNAAKLIFSGGDSLMSFIPSNPRNARHRCNAGHGA